MFFFFELLEGLHGVGNDLPRREKEWSPRRMARPSEKIFRGNFVEELTPSLTVFAVIRSGLSRGQSTTFTGLIPGARKGRPRAIVRGLDKAQNP
jgi:hypothetical protein